MKQKQECNGINIYVMTECEIFRSATQGNNTIVLASILQQ